MGFPLQAANRLHLASLQECVYVATVVLQGNRCPLRWCRRERHLQLLMQVLEYKESPSTSSKSHSETAAYCWIHRAAFQYLPVPAYCPHSQTTKGRWERPRKHDSSPNIKGCFQHGLKTQQWGLTDLRDVRAYGLTVRSCRTCTKSSMTFPLPF